MSAWRVEDFDWDAELSVDKNPVNELGARRFLEDAIYMDRLHHQHGQRTEGRAVRFLGRYESALRRDGWTAIV